MCHSTFQTIQKYYQPSDTRVTHQRGEKDTVGNHLTRMCAHSSISESYEWGFRCIETTRRDYNTYIAYTYIYICVYHTHTYTHTHITFVTIMNCVVETLNNSGSVDRSRPELLKVIGGMRQYYSLYNTYGYISSTQLYIPLYSTRLLYEF